MELTTLIEEVGDWREGTAVLKDRRLVRNVALSGRESRNGYRYTEAALKGAAALYERKPVFLDHAPDKSRPQERSTRDLVGSIVHPRYQDGRLRGDIRVLDTESGRTFLALAESDTPGVGMSHVVLAERNADGTIVERIQDVISVDAVVGPATTKTFHESRAGGETDAEAGGSEEAGAGSGESAEEQIAVLQDEVSRLSSERDGLLAKLTEVEKRLAERSREEQLEAELHAAGLPEYAVTEVFVEQLRGVGDAPERRRLIEERRRVIAGAASQQPRSAERAGGDCGQADEAAFVAAIRGRR